MALHRRDSRVTGPREVVSCPEGAGVVAVRSVPRDRESSGRIEVALLFVKNLIQDLVDAGQGGTDGHLGAVRFNYLAVVGENGHARTDCCLGQINRGDVALLEPTKGIREFCFELGEKSAAVGGWSVFRTRPQGKDYRGGKGISSLA